MIVVTGDRGFIGSELKQYLEAQGKTVHSMDWADRDHTWIVDEPVEWIFHMGGISETNATDWDELVLKNIQSTQDWIRFAEQQGCGITYASTASIYGPWSNSPEYGPVQPQHLYGVSKLTVDNWCAAQDFSVPVQAVRFFNVYGRNEGHKVQPSPVRRYIVQSITQRRLTVWEHEGKLGTRDFVSIDDCIQAMVRLKDTASTGIFNVGTGVQLSFLDIARSIQKLVGPENAQIVLAPMPLTMAQIYQWESHANLERLKSTIQWNPQTVDDWLADNFQQLYTKITKEILQ